MIREKRIAIVLLPPLFLAACAGSATPALEDVSARDLAKSATAVSEEGSSNSEDKAADETIVGSFAPVRNDPVVSRGSEGDWDSDVMRFPYVIEHKEQFHMFYEARAGIGESFLAIGYASSEDGVNWTKSEQNPILEGDGTGFDAQSVARPVVLVGDDGTWIMYYTGADSEEREAIGRAIASSSTGPWERMDDAVVESGPLGAWDHELIIADQIIQISEGYRLYYSGRDASGGSAMIGLAESADGVTWKKFNDPSNDETNELFAESDPILRNGSGWDRSAAWTPNILASDGRWFMVYNAFGNLGAAFSDDGIHWRQFEANPFLRDSSLFHPFILARDDGTYWIYYRDLSDDAIHLLEGTLEFE